MTRRSECRPSEHIWRRVNSSAPHEVEACILCGTRFPCERPACGHVDCHCVRGEELPPGVTLDPLCTCPRAEFHKPHREACPRLIRNEAGLS
jgi:hypothetical protein